MYTKDELIAFLKKGMLDDMMCIEINGNTEYVGYEITGPHDETGNPLWFRSTYTEDQAVMMNDMNDFKEYHEIAKALATVNI